MVWDGMFGERRWVFLFFLLWYDYLVKKILKERFKKKLYLFLGNGKNSTQKIHFKNLTKRTKTILFKIEHLIHLTKKGKKWIVTFLCV